MKRYASLAIFAVKTLRVLRAPLNNTSPWRFSIHNFSAECVQDDFVDVALLVITEIIRDKSTVMYL